MWSLGLLLCLAAVAWYWLQVSRLKELACRYGQQLCMEHQVQWLDETVTLEWLSLRYSEKQGLFVWHTYHFEFSTDGSDRKSGTLMFAGMKLVMVSMADVVERTFYD